jgi:uncharacterized protein HemX
MNLASGGSSDPTLLGIVVSAITTMVVAGLGAAGLAWRRRQDREAQKEDQVVSKQLSEKEEIDVLTQARNEATKYYNLYTFFRGLFYDVQQALRHLVRKLRDETPDMELDQDVVDALALRPEAGDSK